MILEQLDSRCEKLTLSHTFTIPKNNSKWIMDLNLKPKTKTPRTENISVILTKKRFLR